MSAPELAHRLRQSLRKLLAWAEAYQPKMLSERLRYDDDLDEAEDLLDAADSWVAFHGDPETRPDRRARR
jgi:hypothetical protein